MFLNDNLLAFIFRKGVFFVYQCNDLFFEVFSNLFFFSLNCKVIWSFSIIVSSNDIGTKVNENLGDFNFSAISSPMKSSPEIKFISLIILFCLFSKMLLIQFVTISKYQRGLRMRIDLQ